MMLAQAEHAAATPPPIGRLGPFTVLADGTISPAEPELAPRFGYRWRGRRIAARLLPGARIGFSVGLARVPFTAEDAAARRRLLESLPALRSALAEGWRLSLSPDHGIHLEAEAELGGAPTATRLVTAATLFVLALDPVLDLLEEEGARTA
jgi:hypothetical protein